MCCDQWPKVSDHCNLQGHTHVILAASSDPQTGPHALGYSLMAMLLLLLNLQPNRLHLQHPLHVQRQMRLLRLLQLQRLLLRSRSPSSANMLQNHTSFIGYKDVLNHYASSPDCVPSYLDTVLHSNSSNISSINTTFVEAGSVDDDKKIDYAGF